MRELYEPDMYIPKRDGSFPCHLMCVDNKLAVPNEYIHEGLNGSFDIVFDYGRSLQPLQAASGIGLKPEGVINHSENAVDIKKATDNLTLLAANGINRHLFDDINFGVIYTANFVAGFKPVLEAAAREMGKEPWTLLAALRGGQVIHEMTKALGYSPNIPLFRASRVILGDGGYLVGVQRYGAFFVENQVMLADDCIAAAGTTDAEIRMVLEANPKVAKVVSAVGLGVKKSETYLRDRWAERGFGFTQNVAALANGMNVDYYLKVTEQERATGRFPRGCEYRVGDMGSAMSLQEKRGDILRPVIRAVAQGRITEDLIFDATAEFLKGPSQLTDQAQRILNEARR
jgi:hypothetical protein